MLYSISFTNFGDRKKDTIEMIRVALSRPLGEIMMYSDPNEGEAGMYRVFIETSEATRLKFTTTDYEKACNFYEAIVKFTLNNSEQKSDYYHFKTLTREEN